MANPRELFRMVVERGRAHAVRTYLTPDEIAFMYNVFEVSSSFLSLAAVCLACPKRSDNGERRELEEREKKSVRPFFPLPFRGLFSAPLPRNSSSASAPSERLEQGNLILTALAIG